MTKKNFYIFFSIFNIVLIGLTFLCTLGNIILMGCLLFLENPPIYSDILYLCCIIVYVAAIILKLILPQILVNIGQKYNGSTIDKFLRYIKENPKEKKRILLSAFIFDFIILICLSCISRDFLSVLFEYLIIYLGGLFFFYLMLYDELKTYK